MTKPTPPVQNHLRESVYSFLYFSGTDGGSAALKQSQSTAGCGGNGGFQIANLNPASKFHSVLQLSTTVEIWSMNSHTRNAFNSQLITFHNCEGAHDDKE